MNTKQTARAILALLAAPQGSIRTSQLIARFGERTSAALDLLVARRQIIRVRGVGAAVELA